MPAFRPAGAELKLGATLTAWEGTGPLVRLTVVRGLCYGQRDAGSLCMAEILKVKDLGLEAILRRAALLISTGKVVAIPTDTVYGLGADPFNLAAVTEVFRVKGRTPARPLPLLVNSLDQASELTLNPPAPFFSLAKKYWPGPLTIVVPASRLVPLKVTANTGKVGLRWPRAPLAVALIGAMGHALTGTSANLTDHPVCRSAEEVESQIGRLLPLIVDGGPTGDDLASTVVDLTEPSPRVLRYGPIAEDELKEFLG